MSLKEFTVTTSVTNWLRMCDILEEHADEELREGTPEGSAKPGWEFGRQMASQIRENIAVEEWEEDHL